MDETFNDIIEAAINEARGIDIPIDEYVSQLQTWMETIETEIAAATPDDLEG